MVNGLIQWIVLHVPDDPFMYLQLAKNPGLYLKTNGFQPLWAYIITILGFGVKGNGLVILDYALYLAILIAVPFVVKKLYNSWWGLGILLVPTVFIGNGMLELAIAIMLILVAVKKKNGLWSGLMTYARLDLFLLGGLVLIPEKTWKNLKTWNWKQIGIMALVLSPYIIFNLIQFHSIIPDSMKHSYVPNGGGLWNSIHWLYVVLQLYTCPVVLILIGIIGCWKKYKVLIIEFAFLIALDIYKNSAYSWHFTVVAPIIILGYMEIWEYLKKAGIKSSKVVLVAGSVIGIVIVFFTWQNAIKMSYYSWNLAWYNARIIEVNGTRGAFDAGIQGYFSNQYVEDTGGYFIHNVIMPEYFTDYSEFVPKGYTLITDYGNKPCQFGTFGLYRKVE